MITCSHCGLPPKNGRLPRGLCSTCVVALTIAGTYEEHAQLSGFEITPNSQRPLEGGYVSVVTTTGRMAEHRAVMRKMLGRPLVEHENVHHMNGVRDDNRPENLELWLTSQPAGQRIPDLIDYLIEFHRDALVERLGH